MQTWGGCSQFCQSNGGCSVLQPSECGSLLLVTPGRLHELSFAVLLIPEIPGFVTEEPVLSNEQSRWLLQFSRTLGTGSGRLCLGLTLLVDITQTLVCLFV